MEIIFLTGTVIQEPVKKTSKIIPKGNFGKQYWHYKVKCQNDISYGDINENNYGYDQENVVYNVINFDVENEIPIKKGDQVAVSGKFKTKLIEKEDKVHIYFIVFEMYNLCYDNNAALEITEEICNK